MAYTVKTKLGPVRSIHDNYEDEKYSLNVYTGYSTSYSYRTGKNSGLLQLGENHLRANSSVADCLAAERAAIRELDAETESDTLGCGAYSSDDAGHSFSRLKLQTGIRHILGSDGGVTELDYERAYDVPVTDPLTSAMWHGVSLDKPILMSELCSQQYSSNEESALASLLADASHTLVSMYPDKIKGTLGQDLVDLAQLPKLLKHLTDTRRLMGDLQRKWMRLSQSARDIIDSDIKHALRKSTKGATHAASSAALEWLFVLQPYIEDLKVVMNFLAKAEGSCVQRSRRVRTSHAYNSDVSSTSVAPANLSDGDLANGTFSSHSIEYYCRYDYRVTAAFRRRKPVMSVWLEKAESVNQQLGIWYPSLLWDLMPWSFVIDWIANIGDVIDASSEYEAKYHISYSYLTVKGVTMGIFPELPAPDYWLYTCVEAVPPFLQFLTRVPLDPERGLRPQFSKLTKDEKGILALLGLSR